MFYFCMINSIFKSAMKLFVMGKSISKNAINCAFIKSNFEDIAKKAKVY